MNLYLLIVVVRIVSLFIMENGLEVTTKKFNEKNIQILFFDFVQDDNKLFIAIKEEKYNEYTRKVDAKSVMVVWDLFSISDNCVRRLDTFSLFPVEYQRLANSSG